MFRIVFLGFDFFCFLEVINFILWVEVLVEILVFDIVGEVFFFFGGVLLKVFVLILFLGILSFCSILVIVFIMGGGL